MRLITHPWRAVLAAPVLMLAMLMLAACAGNTSATESPASADGTDSTASNDSTASTASAATAATAATAASANSTASAASARSVAKEAAATPASPNGTAIPAAAEIIDSGGNVWTVVGGVIYENGAPAGPSSSVVLLLYDNDHFYQENSANNWFAWNGSTWIPGSDPRATPSANGTAIPSATQITDSSGNIWVVAGGVIYENGALAGYSANVLELAYDGAVIYQENAAGAWWSWNGSGWVASDAPGTATLSWTAPTQNTDGTPLTDLSGYTISYGASPSGLTQTIEVDDPSATSYVVSNLTSGTYYFTVAADATDGTQSAQSAVGSKAIP